MIFIGLEAGQLRERVQAKGNPTWLQEFCTLHANDTRTQQLSRIILRGDIDKNPGPMEKKRTTKYPCKECGKGVCSNQDALLCVECNVWPHAKYALT